MRKREDLNEGHLGPAPPLTQTQVSESTSQKRKVVCTR